MHQNKGNCQSVLMRFFMDNMKSFDPTLVKLARAYSIPPLEWQDIAQELRLHLLLNKDKYNPIRPYKNWAYIVCRRKIIQLFRYWHVKKRDIKKVISLDELLDKGYDIRDYDKKVVKGHREL